MKTMALVPIAALLSLTTITWSDSIDVSGYWRFEEGAGSIAVDSGPYGADGMMNARATHVIDVGVDEVPLYEYQNDGAVNLEWINGTTGGLVTVEDESDLFRMTYTSFSIEAWVRLDHVSNSNGGNQRQWLCQKKAVNAPGAELDYGFLVQAGDLGNSGRELLFQCGDGTQTFTVVSTLSIEDTDWHFVSLVYDVTNRTLRFGLDGDFETLSFIKPYWPTWGSGSEVYDAGPLLIGGHENTFGDKNQFVRGTIDEFRITRTALPVDFLLDATPTDCDGNGINDPIELETPGSDCNGNFVPDSCDLALTPDLDCNKDGKIDSCQAEPARYVYDDGSGEVLVRSDGSWTCWLNRFIATEDIETITSIELLIDDLNDGLTFMVGVWSDPNGDGDPTDAQLLSSATRLVQLTEETWFTINIPDVQIGPPGTSFFVGGIVQTADGWPGFLDADAPHALGQSWIIGANQEIDPDDLSANAVEFATTESFFTGNWMIRGIDTRGVIIYEDCNENGIDDFCDVSSGRSPDDDGDELPDECYIPGTYSVPGQFNDIASAARIVPEGSTVVVGPGTWQGSVVVDGKSIAVVSSDGPDATTIVADPLYGPAVVFNDAESGDQLLEGFTVTGGTRGGVWAINADATIRNNVIRGNDNTEGNNQTGGGVFIYNNSTATVVDNVIEDNTATYGGGIVVSFTLTGDVPVISGNTIRGNTATDTGGGIFVSNGSPVIFGNRIEDNAAPNQDGGGLAVNNSFEFAIPMQLQVVGNVFSGNSASEDGGGVFCIEEPANEPAYFANNLLIGNSAKVGGAMALRYSALLTNNTITGNIADERGGAIFRGGGGGMIEIVNSILWNNDAVIQPEIGGGGGGGVQTLSVAYSNVAGGVTGTGNIDLDPKFVEDGSDYHLASGSPCIDTGTNEVILDGDLDLDGEARIAGATVDMGCYEFQATQCPGDLDGNGAVDGADLTLLLGQWGGSGSADFDQSGTVNGADLAQLLGYWGGCDGG
ncbi:MAG: hypothetical protein MK082_06420 [Phycisphaerales bacterium]|nr:hypothetical protein [Phycisphaerales bacterium]